MVKKLPRFKNTCHNARHKYLHDNNYFTIVKSAENHNILFSSSKHYRVENTDTMDNIDIVNLPDSKDMF